MFKKKKYAIIKEAISKDMATFIYNYFLMKKQVYDTCMQRRYISPYEVIISALKYENPKIKEYSDDIYEQLLNEGISVVLDDRKETPGVKFSDADLLGFPIRITTSERLIEENMIELKLRNSQKSIKIEKNNIIDYIKKK